MAAETVTVTGTYVGLDGEPCSGTVTFAPPCIVRDNLGHVIMSGPVTIALDSKGSFSLTLPCTEQDGLDPSGFAYQVTERLDCSDCLTQYPVWLACEGAPEPEADAVVYCTGDGHSVRMVVPRAIYHPVTVDWGDGTPAQTYYRGAAITHTWWRTSEPLDPAREADLLIPGPPLLSQGTVHQGVVQDASTGDWYVTQMIDDGVQLPGEVAPVPFAERQCNGDFVINRLSSTGTFKDLMYVRGFDHGAAIGLQRTGGTVFLWTGTDATPCSGGARNGLAEQIGRFPYRAGTVLDVGGTGLTMFDPLPQYSQLSPALDLTHNQIAVRYYTGTPKYHIRVYDLDDFLAGDFTSPVYDQPVPYHTEAQSYTVYGQFMYAMHGYPDQPCTIYVIDLATGEDVIVYHNDQHEDFDYREPESILVRELAEGPQLVWGLAVGAQGARRMALYGGPAHVAEQDTAITVTDSFGNPVTVTGVDHIPCA